VKANASVEGTTQITSGGKVSVVAGTSNEVTANAMIMSKNTPLDLCFAGARTKADTDAFLGASTVVTAAGVDVLATTTNDLQVNSSIVNAGAGGVGLGAAYNELDTDTDAYIAGTVTPTIDVNVLAFADTENFLTDSDMRHNGSTKLAETQVSSNYNQFGRDSALAMLGVTPEKNRKAGEKLSLGDKAKEKVINKLFPVLKSGKLNIAGSVVVAITDQTVDAYIAPNAVVNSQGSVTVIADMTDISSSSAAAESTSDGKAIGGSVVNTDLNNTVLANIGSNAVVNARRNVDVQSRVVVPFAWNNVDFTNSETVLAGLTDGLSTMLFTTFTRNKSAGDDLAGNPLSASASDGWTVDLTGEGEKRVWTCGDI
jgi:hypothetical protein